MNRLFKSFVACICLLVLFVQAGWAADGYTLTLNTQPSNAGSFNRSSGQTFAAGASVYMYYYENTDFVFDYWMSGDTIVSRDRYFYFIMPDHDATLTAVFHFDPNSPGNPDSPDQTKKYTLTLNTQPANAGSFNRSSDEQFKAGESVYMYEYNNDGFKFEKWISGDTVVSTNRSFYFTMPAHDAELTAVYGYDPVSPANPDTAQVYYNVTLETQPANAGSFSWNNTTKVVAHSSCDVYAYPNSDFTFREWQKDGVTVGTDRQYRFQMPAENIRLVAVYDYTPANPSNPNKNYWNAETGEVIVDDFTPGNLYDAVYYSTGGNYDNVQMITVAGPISQYDWGVVNNYSNCTYLDMSRTYGMTYVPSYNFSGNTTLTTVILPAGIERIEYYAFRNCSNLSSISIYAATPPTIGNRAFEGIGDSIVYVPADALALYQEAEGWKDFTILPLAKEVSSLEVNLPDGTDPSIYKDMYIELINTKSGQKLRYVITNRTTYTFNSLIHRTSYNVYLKNAQGDVLGEIDGIDIEDKDVSVTFESLKVPRDLTLTVLTPTGEDVTGQTTITWMDAKDTYLTRGNTLTGQMEGTKAKFRISLPQTLGMQYLLPADSLYEVQAENSISVTLKAIPQTTIAGKVTGIKTGQPLSGANVAVSQMLNGLYSKSFTTKTDNKGQWSLQVYEAKTDITASMDDYVSKTQSFEKLVAEIPDFELKDINGTTIAINLTYQPTGGELQEYYSDYANVAYTIYNATAGKNVTELNVQYPQIVLMEQLPAGTVLRVTATSKNQKFVAVTATATVDSLDRASVTLPIVQLGGISASFRQTDNPAVVGILYDGNGRLLKKYEYASATLNINELQDGQYTLVTMASTQLFSTVGSLSQFAEAGLREGVDYVKNSVTVESGKMATIDNPLIPYLDETKLYYTGDGTSISVNKSQITTGNYLTITGHIDFKSAYADQVSDVKLIVNLPENCSFVDNSVMRGAQTATYTYADNQVVVPLDHYGERVRFCFIPTAGGDNAATGSVQFTLNGKTITQPIGNANFTVKDLSISVPSTVAKTTVPVSGVAVGKSTVEVFDNGTSLGQTKALANGAWAMTVDLVNPYNLSTHSIFAKITTKDGVEMQSETKELTYDMNAIQIQKVTMYHYNPEMNKTFESEFDFQNPHTTPNQWTVYYPNKKFTYTVDFTNNSPEKVSNVILYVHTADGQIVPLYPTYDEKKDIWVADIDMGNRSDGYYPVNVSVDYQVNGIQFVADRKKIDQDLQDYEDSVNRSLEEREEMDSLLSQPVAVDETLSLQLNDLLQSEYEAEDLEQIVNVLVEGNTSEEPLYSDAESDMLMEKYRLEFEDDYNRFITHTKDSLLDDMFASEPIERIMSYCDTTDMCVRFFQKREITDFSHLEDDGYSFFVTTDSTKVYFKYTNDTISYVDTKAHTIYILQMDFIEQNLARMIKTHRTVATYATCANRLKNIIVDFNNIRSKGITGRDGVRNLIGLINDVVSAAQCYYEGFRLDLETKMNKSYNDAIADLDSKIADREALISDKQKQISKNTKQVGTEKKTLKNLEAERQKIYLELEGADNLTPARKEYLYEELTNCNNKITNNKNIITDCENAIKKQDEAILTLRKQIGQYNLDKMASEQSHGRLQKILDRLPVRMTKSVKLGKLITNIGKAVGFIGTALQIYDIGSTAFDEYDNLNEWVRLSEQIERRIPCEGQEQEALNLQSDIDNSMIKAASDAAQILCSKLGAFGFDLLGGVPVVTVQWWASSVLDIYAEWKSYFSGNRQLDEKLHYWNAIGQLRCQKDPCDGKPCPDGGGGGSGSGGNGGSGGSGGGGGTGSGSSNDGVKIDPSGYVYEGVASNRLQGVTATAYYKETVEDMYGDLHDNVVLWDAEEYAQENPLFTDEYGMYQWDVPQGLWQVKFEKEGYQTTYSEWLPVPPPQLEVNIAMTQMLQPTVASAKAYSEGVEVTFDKYMNPETLTADNIIVTRNGEVADGIVELLNEEVAYEGQTQTYASKVRFTVPEDAPLLSTDEVLLTVKKTVESYAGVQMQDTYTQAFDVEPRVTLIAVDSLINVAYGGERTLTVAALPADASKGKKMRVQSLSTMIATIDNDELTLDENGQAELKVSGELPGSTVISFIIDDADLKGNMTVNVKDAAKLVTMAPRASRVSGTEVYRGTVIRLTSETEGAVIYYTLDGSCPCNTETALKYNPDEPIVIADEQVTIKAMAQGHDLAESEVSEFTYSLKKTTLGYQMLTGWSWISHNLEEPVPATAFQTNAERIVSQTAEVINDPNVGFIGNLTELLPSEAYKVKVTAQTENRLSGYEYNATENAVSVESGWNWIGYPLNQTMTLTEALAFFAPSIGDYIVGQDGYAEFVDNEWKGTLEALVPGRGYLYKSAVRTEILFNTTIVSNAVSLVGKRSVLNNSPWAYNKYLWKNVMPMTAQLYVSGVKADEQNYVIGAFAGNECRGVGQWNGGRLLMSIYGDDSEDIRFLAADVNTEKFYDISESVHFSADNVGAWYAPYTLTLGGEATGIKEMYGDLIVTPLVARDHITVSAGGKDISRLMLTNMNGVTVLSLTDVGKGATVTTGMLSEGMYIVTVQAEGNTYYKKIIKANK